MPANVDIDIKGIEETLKKLHKYENKKTDQIKKEIKKIGRSTIRKAKSIYVEGNPHKWTRNGKTYLMPGKQTKMSIGAKYLNDGLTAAIAPRKKMQADHPKNGFKRHWVEYGHDIVRKLADGSKKKVGHQEARPYMEKAENAIKPKFIEKMKKLAKEGVIEL